MKTRLLVVSAALLCLPLQEQDADRVIAKGRLAKDLDKLVERYGGIGFVGSVLVAKGGKVLLARGVGHADLEGKKPNTANTLFELASVTKQFTAAAICRLVDQGKLKLEDPISKHLPGIPKDCKAITIRHLLSHTSGIPGTNNKGYGEDLARLIPLFLKGGPKHEPGTHWEYWNQGYSLLSAIIAKAAGMSYTSYCRQELFATAGLTAACFTGDEGPKGASVAIGRSKRGKPRSALEHPYGAYGYQYRGMGGAVCDVWDLWRWHRALAGDKLLSAEIKKQLFKPVLKNYALGWYVRKKKGRLVHSHGGSVRGFMCTVRRYPQQDAAVFVLSNDNDSPFYDLAEALESAIFGEKYATPPVPLSKVLQSEIVGSYQMKKGIRLVVEADGKVTRARIEWKMGARRPQTRGLIGTDGGGLVFFERSGSELLLIRRDDKKAIVALGLYGMKFERNPE